LHIGVPVWAAHLQCGHREHTNPPGRRSGLESKDVEPERCAACGFDGTRLTVADAVTALRSVGPRWRRLFKDVEPETLRTRPSPDVWSALEYTAHTRDVIAMNGWAMNEILKGDHPDFPEIAPDEPGVTTLGELEANAERMAARAEREMPEHWARAARVGAEEMDAGYVLRHAVHDATHHLRDVERVLAKNLEGLPR
jgi:hypothetical protein